MKIGKPILVVTTPVGVAIGLHEAWRLGGGGLLVLMSAFIVLFGVGIATVVSTIRREKAELAASDPPVRRS